MQQGTAYLTIPPWPLAREPGLDAAFELVGADVFARSQRLRGRPVRFAAGCLGAGQGDGGQRWKAMLDALDVVPDDIVWTVEPRHERIARALFLKLARQGDIYKGACGSEEGCLLAVGRYQEPITRHLRDKPDFLQPACLREGLLGRLRESAGPDPCVARAGQAAGTRVPSDPAFVLEPWFDALLSYLTGSGYLDDPVRFEGCWPPEVQVTGEEALAAHAVAWPAMLTALGLPLPHRLVVRSTWPADELATAPLVMVSRQGGEALRCALLAGADYLAGASSPSSRVADGAGEKLGRGLASLVDTVLAAIERECGGVMPSLGRFNPADELLLAASDALACTTAGCIDAFDFRSALQHIGTMVESTLDGAGRAAGLPARQRGATIRALAEATRSIGACLAPLLPRTAGAVLECFGLTLRDAALDGVAHRGVIPSGLQVRLPVAPLPILAGLREGGA